MYGKQQGALSGSASSILERAKGQLQGKRYGVTRSAGSLNRNVSSKDPEEDDLNAYLSQLSKKTGKSSKITQGDDDDDDVDLSDITLSSEEGLDLGVTNSSLNASKFLKKSQSQTLTSGTAKQVPNTATTLKKSSTTPNFLNKTAPAFTSSALQKAAQLGAKFAKKKAAITKKLESDSDEDLNFRKGASSKDVRGRKEETTDEDEGGGSRFLKKTTKKSFYVSDSDEDSIKMEAEESVGRDGNRFLKKSAQPKEEPADVTKNQYRQDSDEVSSEISLDEVPASRFLKKKPSGLDTFSTSTPKKDILQTKKASKEKDRLSRTAPVASSSHLGLGLDSDEEDLKDFIDNLTPTSTPEVPPVRGRIDDDSSNSEDDKFASKTAPKRTVTPGPGKHVAVVSPSDSSSSDISVGEDVNSSVAESIDEDMGGIGANVMQIEDLLPAVDSKSSTATKSKRKKPVQAWSESDKSEAIPSEKEDHQTLNLAGLQSVDDLFAHRKSDHSSDDEDKYHRDYKSDFETATEIATQRTEEIPEESIHSGIPSSRRVKAEETHSYSESFSKSVNDSSTRTVPDSYASDSQATSRSRSSRSYSRSYYSRSKTHSGKRSTSEHTQTYSEDFQSGTDNSDLEELPSDDKDTSTVTKSYTSYSETTTTVTPKKEGRKRRRERMKDAAIQADGVTAGLLHHWITDSDIRGIESVTQKDPTPVTTHVVNPEALEALTNFSPSLLALNDSLLAQLQYTRESVQNSLRLHRSLVDSIENDFEYITLENTKEYIAQHRRRPKLTMEQALIMVKQEMEEEARL